MVAGGTILISQSMFISGMVRWAIFVYTAMKRNSNIESNYLIVKNLLCEAAISELWCRVVHVKMNSHFDTEFEPIGQ